jgi:psp operon transcriptional activator
MASSTPDLPPLIGQSRPFLELMEQASRAAPLDRPILIIGERGTGKELIAARLHYLSGRWERPLVKLNCAALPETLLETELFGHEAGAFTGAVRRRAGRFERADGGSLFLDEIANAPPAVQEKILRVVEYGEFERVGSSATIGCDVRVIAAANVDLPAEAAAGRFRLDLLDRLAFDVLTVPPLRARPDDVPVLAEHFARAMAFDMGWERFPGFAEPAIAEMATYPWPGNVRELRNVAERAVYRWPDPDRPVAAVQFDPFESPYRLGEPPAPSAEPPGRDGAETTAFQTTDFEAAVAGFERELLERALAAARYNQKAAARSLGLGYHQFRNRLRRHDLLKKAAGHG